VDLDRVAVSLRHSLHKFRIGLVVDVDEPVGGILAVKASLVGLARHTTRTSDNPPLQAYFPAISRSSSTRGRALPGLAPWARRPVYWEGRNPRPERRIRATRAGRRVSL